MRIIDVIYEGKPAKAEEVDFTVVDEPWTSYELADGSRVKMKQIAISFARLIDIYKPDGEPLYQFQLGGITHVDAAPRLKQRKTE